MALIAMATGATAADSDSVLMRQPKGSDALC